jgi:iron complex outermembrane receptor protein
MPSGTLYLTAIFGACVAVAPDARAQPAEAITVTAAPNTRSATTTTLLSSSEIANSGASSLGSLLDQLPAFGSQGVNGAQNDGGYGEYFIDLRNLNFDRTLVLVDGKRFVLSGIQTDEAVDLNNIPLAFIDHVEVLRDGTQPQYAADAVAGAVNVVLKDQVEGMHLASYGGAATAGGAGTADISLTGGHAFQDGHIAFGLDAYDREPVPQSDRAWAADPIASAAFGPSGSETLFGSPATLGGHAIGDGVDAVALGGGRTAAYDPARDFYNQAADRYLQGGLQRASAYLDGDAMLTDSVSADAELLFTDRRATTLLPPQTLGLTGTVKYPDGFVVPASNPYNPFGTAVTLERVVGEAGDQQTTTSGPVWRVLGGLDGSLGAWDWSLAFDHGQSFSRYDTTNDINLARALQSADDPPYANWFGPGSLSPLVVRAIDYTGRTQSAYSETIGQARIGGPVVRLPGGEAHITLGAERRFEYGSTTVDSVTALGDQAGPDAQPTSGGYDTYEAYTTIDLPLLRDLSGVRRLNLELAARETATSRYGSFPTLRAVLDYVPLQGLHLHAVTGTARRPPAISEAFGGISASQLQVADPCAAANGLRGNAVVAANCASQGLGPNFVQSSPLIQVESGGNPHLHPEQSENETLGATLTPPALPWLELSADYYHYRIRDAIDSLADSDPNLIPDLCYESAHLSSPECSLITRIRGGGNAGQIGNILALDENVGTIKTDGLEFGAAAHTKLPGGVQLRLDTQTNWLLDFRLRTIGETNFTQYAGTFPGLGAGGSYARVRSRTAVNLDWAQWSAGWTSRFISGAHLLGQAPDTPYSTAPGVFYEDVELTRRFKRVTAMMGVDNLLDRRPPTLIDGETNTSTATYDVVGRLVWARIVCVF